MEELERLLSSKEIAVVQTAPSVRVSLGEEFGLKPGADVTGRVVASLRMLGFKYVFDTDFGAEVTVLEEAQELLERLEKQERLPLFTSCCPGWTRFCLKQFPSLENNLSECKAPQQILASLAKTYFAKKIRKPAKDVVVVSVMPCFAKKLEAKEREHAIAGAPQDVDLVITTHELAQLLKARGIDLRRLSDEEFDNPLGVTGGAGALFGATGGIAEAIMRTAYHATTGGALPRFESNMRPALGQIKEYSIVMGERDVHLAIVQGYPNASVLCKRVLEERRNGMRSLDFVEVLGCIGGCVGGPGQPDTGEDAVLMRAAALHERDRRLPLRSAHDNPAIKKVYASMFGKPGSARARRLLHRGQRGYAEMMKTL